MKRNENGTRHKDHHDRRWYMNALILDLLRYTHFNWPYKPTGLTNEILKVDSTEFNQIDYDKIIAFIKSRGNSKNKK